MSNNKQTSGYICPKTTKQCDDECCVSTEQCHIEAWEKTGALDPKLNNIEEITWDEYGNPIPLTDETNSTPTTIDMWALRQGVTMYLDDLDSYGTDAEVNTAIDVLWDFVKYVEAMGVSVDDEDEMDNYNEMEEEWEMDNYNEMEKRAMTYPSIEEQLKEGIRQAIITLYNFDVTTGRYVNEELQKEKMIKEIVEKWDGKYSEEAIREAMNTACQQYKQTHGDDKQ